MDNHNLTYYWFMDALLQCFPAFAILFNLSSFLQKTTGHNLATIKNKTLWFSKKNIFTHIYIPIRVSHFLDHVVPPTWQSSIISGTHPTGWEALLYYTQIYHYTLCLYLSENWLFLYILGHICWTNFRLPQMIIIH